MLQQLLHIIIKAYCRLDTLLDFINSINLPAFQTTCPAFGGADCNYLFVTSALIDITHPRDTDGQTFVGKLDIIGQKEYKVTL